MAKPLAVVPDPDAPRGLTPFEGQDVLSATIAIRNAGDGLSKAMNVAPVEYHSGDTVHVVLECEVTDVTFKPVKDTDGLMRVHAFKAGTATIVDESIVRAHLDAQELAIEKAAGISRLPGMDGPAIDNDPDSDPLNVFNDEGDAPE